MIRKATSGGTIQSRHIPVYPGTSYMVVVGESDIQAVVYRPNGHAYVEIITPTPSVDPYTLDIDWYLSGLNIAEGLKIGTTQNIGPDTSAFFQPGNGTLMFMPVAAGKRTQTYAPSEIPPTTTTYQPPSYVTKVGVVLQANDTTGALGYSFDQPNALTQG